MIADVPGSHRSHEGFRCAQASCVLSPLRAALGAARYRASSSFTLAASCGSVNGFCRKANWASGSRPCLEAVVGIAGDEDHLEIRSRLAQLGHHGRPVHLRHDDVGDDDIDLAVVAPPPPPALRRRWSPRAPRSPAASSARTAKLRTESSSSTSSTRPVPVRSRGRSFFGSRAACSSSRSRECGAAGRRGTSCPCPARSPGRRSRRSA